MTFCVVPVVVAGLIVASLFWLQNLEVGGSKSLLEYLLIYDASPQGAQVILRAIATAVMTFVGVLFLIVVIVLQQLFTHSVRADADHAGSLSRDVWLLPPATPNASTEPKKLPSGRVQSALGAGYVHEDSLVGTNSSVVPSP